MRNGLGLLIRRRYTAELDNNNERLRGRNSKEGRKDYTARIFTYGQGRALFEARSQRWRRGEEDSDRFRIMLCALLCFALRFALLYVVFFFRLELRGVLRVLLNFSSYIAFIFLSLVGLIVVCCFLSLV
jgi:hypothetical protein